MKFTLLDVAGAFHVQPEPACDARGLFARTYCEHEFEAHGLHTHYPQSGTSYNQRRGTLRGLHLQRGKHVENKLIRCTAGAVYDVVADVRSGSPTFGRWAGVELTAEGRSAVYAPAGVAHGFITLCDGAEIFYQLGNFYAPQAACGVRWDDDELAIKWPFEPLVISDGDRALPGLQAFIHESKEHG